MSDAAKQSPPLLYKLPYEDDHPKELWLKCKEFQERWEKDSGQDSQESKKIRESMSKFKIRKALNLVWMSNKLEGTLPSGASEYETYKLLTSLLTDPSGATSTAMHDGSADIGTGKSEESDKASRSIDNEGRTSKWQLQQHMQAYLSLQNATKEELSCELILSAHRLLMDGLENDGRLVKAGEYRTMPVHAGDYSFPDSKCIPQCMDTIVKKYNLKFADDHDPFELASFLLYQVITLHPFEDGNGRLCRLLWCYSLMRDGLPFPTVLTSGHTKAYKHYIRALQRSQRTGCYSSLTSLTVLSVSIVWQNFFLNWEYECPKSTL